jgi:hypothetical protein
LPGVAAELIIALTAGDVAEALEVALDAGEFGVEGFVVDRLAVDGQGHGGSKGCCS